MKDKDKRFIKNWQTISVLNIDYKIISIGKNGRLIVGIIEITDVLIKEAYLITMDIEKVFDPLDHTFVISVLKKFGFGKNFVSWIETSISKQES